MEQTTTQKQNEVTLLTRTGAQRKPTTLDYNGLLDLRTDIELAGETYPTQLQDLDELIELTKATLQNQAND